MPGAGALAPGRSYLSIRAAGIAVGTNRYGIKKKEGTLDLMRSDRYKDNAIEQENSEDYLAETPEEETPEAVTEDSQVKAKGLFSRKKKSEESSEAQAPDLSRIKKKELLEIMLAQSKEIDSLREKVADLEAQLANREFEFSKIGSIAEASLAVTEIFKEAEKAAVIYIENIRRRYEKKE